MERRITPVILSGGSGTRLWPLSVDERPKQFLALTGEATMLQMTAMRVVDRNRFDAPVVVASARHADLIDAQLAAVGAAPSRIVLEPMARNTGPAIALAALGLEPDALMLVMPSDHLIGEEAAFHAAVAAAEPLARDGWLATFGIRPDRAETGYGYIRRAEPIGEGVYRAERFVEKPDAATAAGYLADGGYDWNGGIFLFRADTYLEALAAYEPEMLAAARAAMAGSWLEGDRLHPDAQAFARAPSRSIDHAVMEQSDRVAVAPVAMGWSDVGSFDALHELGAPDAAGNVTDARAIAIDSAGCLLRSDGPAITVVGVNDLIVVATPDSVLVVPRGHSQRVKEAAEAAKRG